MTKSKKPWLYLEFLPYSDSDLIPYEQIAAKHPGVSAPTLRGMIRAAKHETTISEALYNLYNILPEDIPSWFMKPKWMKTKLSKRKEIKAEKTTPEPIQQPVEKAPKQTLANIAQNASYTNVHNLYKPQHYKEAYIPGFGRVIDLSPPDPLEPYRKELRQKEQNRRLQRMAREARIKAQEEKNFQFMFDFLRTDLNIKILNRHMPSNTDTREDYEQALVRSLKLQNQLLENHKITKSKNKSKKIDLEKEREERRKYNRKMVDLYKKQQDKDFDDALTLSKAIYDLQNEKKRKRLARNFPNLDPSIWN